VAADFSSDEDSGVIIEEMFQNGEEYRILASQEKVIGIVKREPANVIGDGRSTIKKLITLKNKEDIRGIKGSDKSHLKIRMDKNLKNYLAEQNLDLSTVVAAGRKVYLRQVSNISQGGDAIDFTDLAHKSVHEIALKAIRTIPGLSFAGIDFMTLDITQPQTKDSYVIIEINDSPGFDIHDAPYVGQNRHAADEFLKLMFPELDI
jgi:glutamate--cysteine ligase